METYNEYLDLVKLILYHNDLYYNQDEPEISDYEYDQLMMKLKKMEKEHPEWVSPDSPTQKITGEVKQELGVKVEHVVPMLSLADYFSKEEVEAWYNSVMAEYPDSEFVVEQKIDGLSLSVEYHDGAYFKGSTRGNGIIGEDVSENVKMLRNVPKSVENIPLLEVRGECYMSQEDFLKANEKQDREGGKLFKNARNCAAGSLRQKDPQITKERNLDVIVFNLQRVEGKTFTTHSETLEYMKSQGFFVSPDYAVCKKFDEIWNAIQKIGSLRNRLPYGIDGAVIKVNSLAQREEMGNTAKVPRWAIAYKYPPEQKETLVRDIVLQVGRTGRITPVCVFDTIELAGTSVSKATLHNQDFINRIGVNVGDTILVEKSGDIIPYIVKVVKKNTDSNFQIPDYCPVCGHHVSKVDSDYRCTNPECEAQILGNIEFFASRPCMNIMGLAGSKVQKLHDAGYIRKISDIYRLKERREEMIADNVIGKEKSVDNLINAIETSKDCEYENFIKSLGIRNVGRHAGKILQKKYPDVLELANAKFDDLKTLDGVGETVAQNIVDYFSNEDNMSLVRDLLAFVRIKSSEVGNKLEGKTFVVTGTLPTLSRDDAAKLIEQNGGKVSSSVSKKTSYVLAGENAGSKLTKAQDLGITIITETDLLNMVN